MEYPRELVHKYGAKAGILMYVAKELPGIPQAAMIVNEPGETTEDFLKRADEVDIGWPRLFRSSAVAELDGYEGVFPTLDIELIERVGGGYSISYLKPGEDEFGIHQELVIQYLDNKKDVFRFCEDKINFIKTFPSRYKKENPKANLPDEINVIIAEKSPSKYTGTLIKHPNQDDYYLMSIRADQPDLNRGVAANNPLRSAFSYRRGQGLEELKHFSQGDITISDILQSDGLLRAILWHDRIANLPEMDRNWTYQLEFGLDPLCLYQVRPFLKKCKADFQLKPSYEEQHYDSRSPIVFGVTPFSGIIGRVVDLTDKRDNGGSASTLDYPIIYIDKMRKMRMWKEIPNYGVLMLEDCLGILAHEDIGAIRKAEVAVSYSLNAFQRYLQDGQWVNVVSDGTRINVRKIKSPQKT